MPRYDVSCVNGHEHEVTRAYERRLDPCPECGADVELVWRRLGGAHGDDIPGGMWVENGFKDPIKVYSHSEHRRKLAENGCEIRAKWAGPGDKHLKRWDVPTEKTLRDAAILLSRGGKAQKDDVPPAPEALVKELRERLYH